MWTEELTTVVDAGTFDKKGNPEKKIQGLGKWIVRDKHRKYGGIYSTLEGANAAVTRRLEKMFDKEHPVEELVERPNSACAEGSTLINDEL